MSNSLGKTLTDLKPGQDGVVLKISGNVSFKRRVSALGLVTGTKVSLSHTAPLGDPRAYQVLDYTLSLRNEEANMVLLQPAG